MAFETSIILTVENRDANKRIAETRAEFASLANTVRRGVAGMNSDMADLGTPLERAQARVAELRRAFAGMQSDTAGVAAGG